MEKKYRIELLVSYDKETKLEVWQMTKLCSENIEALLPFATKGYRIVEISSGKEVCRYENDTI
ncbi:hypothetical protein GCM10023310_70290 [Paenibacillus vulneris]|uniref:Uncharacterized protein n=1 Tax=Paenibacillus vulneris TaxID=1133364 RepID=A0ABW3UG38_9BACL